MKYLILSLFVIVIFASCKKQMQVQPDHSSLLEQVKIELKDSMQGYEYSMLDFQRSALLQLKEPELQILRVPYTNEKFETHFVLLHVSEAGNIKAGRIVSVNGDANYGEFNGHIIITDLRNATIVRSSISNGYVDAFHPLNRSESMLDPYKELPEVVVVSSYVSDGGINLTQWMSLLTFFGANGGGYYGSGAGGSGGELGGGGGGAYYGQADPFAGGPGGTAVPTYSEPIYIELPMEMEREYIYQLDAINVKRYFACFDNVPSNGATYTIKLSADVPSNNDPGSSINFTTASPGHSFVTITKTNGTNSVTQSFGFYPAEAPGKLEVLDPLPSEILDNGEQEINASIEMTITAAQFQQVKDKALVMASHDYNITRYNCTNYAMDVFNAGRSTPLTIPTYTVSVPGLEAFGGIVIEKSPQMLFTKLREMKRTNHPEAAKIIINPTHTYTSPLSKGECN